MTSVPRPLGEVCGSVPVTPARRIPAALKAAGPKARGAGPAPQLSYRKVKRGAGWLAYGAVVSIIFEVGRYGYEGKNLQARFYLQQKICKVLYIHGCIWNNYGTCSTGYLCVEVNVRWRLVPLRRGYVTCTAHPSPRKKGSTV